jgi:hypothetical protein
MFEMCSGHLIMKTKKEKNEPLFWRVLVIFKNSHTALMQQN